MTERICFKCEHFILSHGNSCKRKRKVDKITGEVSYESCFIERLMPLPFNLITLRCGDIGLFYEPKKEAKI